MNISELVGAALLELGRPCRALTELAGERPVFLVGGTIRDIIMGRKPNDFDFAVGGSGVELAQMLAKKLRASFVLLSEEDDLARVVYRPRRKKTKATDGSRLTADGPEPNAEAADVAITMDFNGFGERSVVDDLRRRDFTANAIAFPVNAAAGDGGAGLVDPFDGQPAIAAKRLVPVSGESLSLDPLRVLRAFRFALELGFAVDDAVLEQAQFIDLEAIAPERTGYELMRIMSCDGSFRWMVKLYELGLLHQMLPEASALFDYQQVMAHSLRTYEKLEEMIHRPSWFSQFAPEFAAYFAADPERRALLKLAGLLHDVSKPETEFVNDRNEVHFYRHDALGSKKAAGIGHDRLRLSRDAVKMLKTLVEHHMRLHLLATGPMLTERAIRRFFRDLGDQWFGLMMLTFADGFATAGFTRHLEAMFTRIIALKREFDAVVKVKRLVTGEDLIALGLRPGPVFKAVLAELEELQIEGCIRSTQDGLDYVKANEDKLGINMSDWQEAETRRPRMNTGSDSRFDAEPRMNTDEER